MNLQLLSFLLGALLLLVGILGGGFEIKEIKVPKVGAMPRLGALVAGIFFLYVGFFGHQTLLESTEPPAAQKPAPAQPADADQGAVKTDVERPPQAQGTPDPLPPPEPAPASRDRDMPREATSGQKPVQADQPPPVNLFDAFRSALAPVGPRDPLDDPRVRSAVELAIHREDLARARQLLAEAGYPQGFALHLRLSRFRESGATLDQAEMLSHNLASIGIRVESTPD
jgi:hypothetical protein